MVRNRIRQYRLSNNLSQEGLLSLLQSSKNRTVLSLLESGHVLPTQDVLKDLCRVFNCSITDLYEESDLLLFEGNDNIGLASREKFAMVSITEETEEALSVLGYLGVDEWLRECKRMLLFKCDTRKLANENNIMLDTSAIKISDVILPHEGSD